MKKTALFLLLPFLSACAQTGIDSAQTTYGDDMLQSREYGNDMLPSALSRAFQRADARYNYQNASIEYDAQECAVYQGMMNGQTRTQPLTDQKGAQICPGNRSEGNLAQDMLPSAEVNAFQRADARYQYQNARIAYDGNSCAMYSGTVDRRTRTQPLLGENGQPLCRARR